LHTRADRPHATREPLQFGAEIFGHAGLEADLEVQCLAIEALRAAGFGPLQLDMADVRIVNALLAGAALSSSALGRIHAALANKDAAELAALLRAQAGLSAKAVAGLQALPQLYGDRAVLAQARRDLAGIEGVSEALDELERLDRQLASLYPQLSLSFDLADLRGYAYYSGIRFAIYGSGDELARGGRYDEVGAVFGRKRPAAGFSLDLKELVSVLPARPLRPAVRAPWGADPQLRRAIAGLRAEGQTVVCVLPGHEHEVHEFECDRELVRVAEHWVVQALDRSA
jgi:ATP phosphoribosyltransferase regulatory subunit